MAEAIGNEVVGAAAGPLRLAASSASSAEGRRAGCGAAEVERLWKDAAPMSDGQATLGGARARSRPSATTPTAILAATEELMRELIARNELEPERW